MCMKKWYISLGKQLLKTHEDRRTLPRYKGNTDTIEENCILLVEYNALCGSSLSPLTMNRWVIAYCSYEAAACLLALQKCGNAILFYLCPCFSLSFSYFESKIIFPNILLIA